MESAKGILDWLMKNSQWVFSGIGVAVVSAIWSKIHRKSSSTRQRTNLDAPFTPTTNQSPVINISNVYAPNISTFENMARHGRQKESNQNAESTGVPSKPENTRIICVESLEEIRLTTGVRPILDIEEGLSINQLPNGIYGYAVPWILNTDPVGVVGGTGVDKMSLSRRSFGTAEMEIHKATDGAIYIVGFACRADIIRLQNPSRNDPAHAMIFFGPHEEFSQALAIPASHLKEFKFRSIGQRGCRLSDVKVL